MEGSAARAKGCAIAVNVVINTTARGKIRTYRSSEAPFTRYNLLTNRLSNRFDNRLNEQWLFVQHGCQTGRLYNPFDNRLYRVNGVSHRSQTRYHRPLRPAEAHGGCEQLASFQTARRRESNSQSSIRGSNGLTTRLYRASRDGPTIEV